MTKGTHRLGAESVGAAAQGRPRLSTKVVLPAKTLLAATALCSASGSRLDEAVRRQTLLLLLQDLHSAATASCVIHQERSPAKPIFWLVGLAFPLAAILMTRWTSLRLLLTRHRRAVALPMNSRNQLVS